MTLADIKSSPHLGKLRLGEEVYKGTNLECKAWVGLSTNLEKLAGLGLTKVWTIDATSRRKSITAVWNDEERLITNPSPEPTSTSCRRMNPPALMDRVQGIVSQVEAALPNFLALTNQIAATLSNSVQLTSNLNAVAAGIRPAVADVAAITANLRDPARLAGRMAHPHQPEPADRRHPAQRRRRHHQRQRDPHQCQY